MIHLFTYLHIYQKSRLEMQNYVLTTNNFTVKISIFTYLISYCMCKFCSDQIIIRIFPEREGKKVLRYVRQKRKCLNVRRFQSRATLMCGKFIDSKNQRKKVSVDFTQTFTLAKKFLKVKNQDVLNITLTLGLLLE